MPSFVVKSFQTWSTGALTMASVITGSAAWSAVAAKMLASSAILMSLSPWSVGPVRAILKQPVEIVAQLMDRLIERLKTAISASQHDRAFHNREDVTRKRVRLNVGGQTAACIGD